MKAKIECWKREEKRTKKHQVQKKKIEEERPGQEGTMTPNGGRKMNGGKRKSADKKKFGGDGKSTRKWTRDEVH